MSRFTCLSLGKIAGTMALTRGLFDSSRNGCPPAGCPPAQKDARYPVGERVGVHGKSKQMSLEIKTTAQLFHAKRVNFLQSRSEYIFFIFLIMFLSFVIIFASSSAKHFPKMENCNFPRFFSFFIIFLIIFLIMFHHFCFQWCKNFPDNENCNFPRVFFHFFNYFSFFSFSSFLHHRKQK